MSREVITTKIYAYISSEWIELDEVKPTSVNRGMLDNLPETRLGAIGDMTFLINNSTGIYTPGITAGWKKGVPVKLVITYDNDEWIKFRGFIEDIELESKPGQKTVKITALDWFDYASKYPIVNPQLLENQPASVGVFYLVDGMPIQPQAQVLEVGDHVFDTLFDTVRGHTKAYGEFAKLANSEIGRIYLRADKENGETLIFENSTSRNGMKTTKQIITTATSSGARLTEDGNRRITEDGAVRRLDETTPVLVEDKSISTDIEYGRNIINRFVVNAYPKRTDTEAVEIYRTERDIFLASGETKVVRAFWRDPDGKRQINARPPSGTSNVKSICHFDIQNGLRFPDEMGKVWTAGEYDMFLSSIVKFGAGAAYFDGSASFITTPHSPDWEFGSGDFTVEWWEYRFASTSGMTAFSRNGAASVPAWQFGVSNGSSLLVNISSNGSSFDIANGQSLGAITTDTWNHFAISRTGSSFKAYKNFALTSSWTSSGTILSSSTPLYLGRNVSTYLNAMIDEIRIIKGEGIYPDGIVAIEEPFFPVGAFFHMWSGENSSGTDISSSLTKSAVYGTEGATFTLTNNSSSNGYVSINISGYGIYSDSPLEDTQEDGTSIGNYGYQNETLQQAYQQNLYAGHSEAKRVIELERNPRTVLNSTTMIANTSPFMMKVFLDVDVGDLVHIVEAKHNLDTMAYVEGLKFTISYGGIVRFTWILRRAWTLEKGLAPIAVEFDGVDSGVNFGYIPHVSSSTITRRLFTAWIWLDATHANKQVIQSVFSDQAGVYFYIKENTRTLKFYSSLTATAGEWESEANVVTTGQWVHVAVVFYNDNTTGLRFYVDGVAAGGTEVVTHSGAQVSEQGAQIVIGNVKSASINYAYPFDGKIKDARIYDVSSVDALSTFVGNIFADGVGGTNYYDGVLHNAFFVRDDYLDDFIDETLVTQKVLDAFMGYVGEPYGSPIAREI